MPAVFNRFIIFQDKCLGADWVCPLSKSKALSFTQDEGRKCSSLHSGVTERRAGGRVDVQEQFLDGFLCSGLYAVLV